ncbi:hypothetical protein MGYG_08588 [Nannizzia gypsea CBS 118893]|uniref:Uncharacterized protein n=1 Tax=Arthroderma gypseum (strain ATCC MYA-4604 / CBS 118893) TaxID=535722 RepID=E4V6E9_ARTGP|nr:hypothetical protein MGYG_08588 [Nannizzia gypsea CBS 118893]EFQ96665.1 hypothetical protein MGYG_08588 [Nannizzia gypsea CBS 118893]
MAENCTSGADTTAGWLAPFLPDLGAIAQIGAVGVCGMIATVGLCFGPWAQNLSRAVGYAISRRADRHNAASRTPTTTTTAVSPSPTITTTNTAAAAEEELPSDNEPEAEKVQKEVWADQKEIKGSQPVSVKK